VHPVSAWPDESRAKEHIIAKGSPTAALLDSAVPENTAFHLNLIDVLHEGAIITDLEGRIARSNDAAFDVFGYSPAELRNQNIALLSEDSESVSSLLRETLQSGVLRLEFAQKTKLQKAIQVQLTVSVLRDIALSPCGLLWLYVDVTPVKAEKNPRGWSL